MRYQTFANRTTQRVVFEAASDQNRGEVREWTINAWPTRLASSLARTKASAKEENRDWARQAQRDGRHHRSRLREGRKRTRRRQTPQRQRRGRVHAGGLRLARLDPAIRRRVPAATPALARAREQRGRLQLGADAYAGRLRDNVWRQPLGLLPHHEAAAGYDHARQARRRASSM